MSSTRISLSDTELGHLLDALSYYRASDYGHGEVGEDERDPEQREHRIQIEAATLKLERAYERLI